MFPGSSQLIGNTLGHYEVTALLGKGGMGEVYRARDTKLDRDVALKILPEELTLNETGVARFEREAKTLAQLQHPNIASIYGMEGSENVRFLVLELADGEELAQRIRRGPIPIDETIRIARQIAEGIETAHSLGIIHRDLKPANIKVGARGDVKILDFGLARAFSSDLPDPESPGATIAPTLPASLTQAGSILGTPAYMSPEQARGQPVDQQSDVWSFGVVLFEMLTGSRLFEGSSASDSMGAVLHRDVDLSELPPDSPHSIRRLLRRCLERDPQNRLRHIGDAILELSDTAAEDAIIAPDRTSRAGWIAAAGVTVIALVLAWLAFFDRPVRGLEVTTVGLSKNHAMRVYDGYWPSMDISPDGTQVVYAGRSGIRIRELGSFDERELAAGGSPAFSPDGQWVAHRGGHGIMKTAVTGGASIELCGAGAGPGITWYGDTVYFAPSDGGGIWSVPAEGGEPKLVSHVNTERGETSHRWPHVLPGGRHALVTIKTERLDTFDEADIGLLSLESGEVDVILRGGSHARYVDTGHIVYGRDSKLLAVGFDLDRLTVNGTPFPVHDQVLTVARNGGAHFSISRSGDLAFVPLDRRQAIELRWVGRTGKVSPVDVDNERWYPSSVSPDGIRIAAWVPGANDKIWIYDSRRNTKSRLTYTAGNDRFPIWSPDARAIAFSNDGEGSFHIFTVPADGSSQATKVWSGPTPGFPDSWSPNGPHILFTHAVPGTGSDIWLLDLETGEVVPHVASQHMESGGVFSPSGNWIAYISDASGDPSVYVRPFPGPGDATRISVKAVLGSRKPAWGPGEDQVYYKVDDRILGVSVDLGDAVIVGEPEEIVAMEDAVAVQHPITVDGKRFLTTKSDPTSADGYQIKVIFDWADRLRGR